MSGNDPPPFVFEDGESVSIGPTATQDYTFARGDPFVLTEQSDFTFVSGVPIGTGPLSPIKTSWELFAIFDVTNITSNTPILPGEQFVIDFTVTNNGNTARTGEMRFIPKDTIVERLTFNLDVGESEDATVTWSPPASGDAAYGAIFQSRRSSDIVWLGVDGNPDIKHHYAGPREGEYADYGNVAANFDLITGNTKLPNEIHDYAWSPDGTRVIIARNFINSYDIGEFLVPAPYNLNTVIQRNSFKVYDNSGDRVKGTIGTAFNEDGTALYSLGHDGRIRTYSLGTPFTLAGGVSKVGTTASILSNSYIGLSWNPDGTRLFTYRNETPSFGPRYEQHNLSSPFAVSSIAGRDLASGDGTAGFSISPDGKYVHTGGFSDPTLTQAELGTPFDITTIQNKTTINDSRLQGKETFSWGRSAHY